MLYTADLHIHSLYSRATSKDSTLQGLAAWAALKGIQVVATGDFTHPAWFASLYEELEPAEPGFFRLKNPQPPNSGLPLTAQPDTSTIRFVLSAEISSIYKRGGRVRKVHNLLYAPDFEAVRRINKVLAGIGNLEADGRPILGLDSQTLLAILLDQAPQGFLVPAHIWTPWFSLFGSKSGFESMEECFGDLSSEIFALETGLSSDPAMNRRISALDRYALISNSDCHSPAKLGREANVFAADFDFFSLRAALRQPSPEQRLAATIEFYPEEGKYHCDGHRACGLCFEPHQTQAAKGLCPHCGKPLTVGVLHRVLELADRKEPLWPENAPLVHSLIPLTELLGELFHCGSNTKKVQEAYARLLHSFGSEFRLLLDVPLAEISTVSPLLAKAVERVRTNQVFCKPGFDGEFGVITVFTEEERAEFSGQLQLFGLTAAKSKAKRTAKALTLPKKKKTEQRKTHQQAHLLNSEQQAAVHSKARRIVVQAGPGTGKTHTLVQRALALIEEDRGPLLLITFTNKAAEEIRQRLGKKHKAHVETFHSFCLHWLRRHKPQLSLAGPEMREHLVRTAYPEHSERERQEIRRQVALFLANQEALTPADGIPAEFRPYFAALRQAELLDLDEIVPACVALLQQYQGLAAAVRTQVAHLLVDEFQDLNAAQYALVCLLGETCSLFAIGDPNQAIYGFRGAKPIWFHTFISEQQPEQHVLRQNYRSGSQILVAAAALIRHNYGEEEQSPMPHAASSKQGRIHYHLAAHAAAEARYIAEQIQHLLGGTSHREIERLRGAGEEHIALSDIAILCRTARQMPLIVEALAERSLPCQVLDLEPFYLKGPARLLYYGLLLAGGQLDSAELLVLLSHEKGLEQFQSSDPALEQLAAQLAPLSPLAACEVVQERYQLPPEEPDLLRFRNLAAAALSLPDFLNHLRKHQDSLIYDERAEAVLLATLHAVKGLEFKAVFIAACEEGLLPLASRTQVSAEEELQHIQEERRLFYVGLTRAAEILYLSAAQERQRFAAKHRPEPSRFLQEIPDPLRVQPPKAKKKRAAKQLKLF